MVFRITPACAGNTISLIAPLVGGWDHPRMRGKHTGAVHCLLSDSGSPPHARETLRLTRLGAAMPRITPACAGNTPAPEDSVSVRRDHPRMRGKHSPEQNAGIRSRGSPPHARETPIVDISVLDIAGITPACAGNTLRRRSRRRTG